MESSNWKTDFGLEKSNNVLERGKNLLLVSKEIHIIGGKAFTLWFENKTMGFAYGFAYGGEVSLPDGRYDNAGLITGIKEGDSPEYVVNTVSNNPAPEVFYDLSKEEAQAIKNVSVYCSNDEIKYIMCGILFDKKNSCIVATDGGRLIKTNWSKFGKEEDQTLLFTSKMLSLLAKKGSRLAFNNDGVFVVSKDGQYIFSKAIDGVFPNYMRVIPNSPEQLSLKMEIKNPDAFKVASKVVDKKTKRVFITKEGDVNVDLESEVFNASKGMIYSEIDTMAINCSFMQDAIDAGARLFMGCGPKKPLFSEWSDGELNYTTVIMPMLMD